MFAPSNRARTSSGSCTIGSSYHEIGKTNQMSSGRIVELPSGAGRAMRTYGNRCGIARALDIVGERWALLVVRELLLGPKRFTDLRTGLPDVGTDVLAQRLPNLDDAGVLPRRTVPPPA